MDNNFGATLGITIALLIAILVGVMVYFSVAQTGEFPAVTERYTGLTATANVVKTLTYTPNSASDFSGTYYNTSSATWGTLGAGMFTRSGNSLTILTDTGTPKYTCENITKVNVTYYTATGVAVKNNVNPAASTSFTLAPIIGIVLIAGIILGYVTMFGKPKA